MRIHTNKLTLSGLRECLAHAKASGKVTQDIEFVVESSHGSRSHARAFDIQLGTYDQHSGPTNSRHFKNTGTHGASHIWAATYDEWGHFLALVFLCDRDAKAGQYEGHADFHKQTNDAYLTVTDEHARDYARHSAAGRYMGD